MRRADSSPDSSRGAPRPTILKVDVDNSPTAEDVRVWARRMGHDIVGEEKAGEMITFSIRKGA